MKYTGITMTYLRGQSHWYIAGNHIPDYGKLLANSWLKVPGVQDLFSFTMCRLAKARAGDN